MKKYKIMINKYDTQQLSINQLSEYKLLHMRQLFTRDQMTYQLTIIDHPSNRLMYVKNKNTD